MENFLLRSSEVITIYTGSLLLVSTVLFAPEDKLFMYKRRKLDNAVLHPNARSWIPKGIHMFLLPQLPKFGERGMILLLYGHNEVLSRLHFVTLRKHQKKPQSGTEPFFLLTLKMILSSTVLATCIPPCLHVASFL